MCYKRVWMMVGIVVLSVSCREEPIEVAPAGTTTNGPATPEWLIPVTSVVDGGTGRDGIPSIDDPKFRRARDISSMPDFEFVVAVKVGDEVRAYPHNILNWHEIVNDKAAGAYFAVTYCPLTGTTLVWDSEEETTFGVSGLLYNSNLIPYDRSTISHWSQMLNQSVQGVRAGREILRMPAVELRWIDFKRDFPDARVLTTDTGFDRNYNSYPYGTYRVTDDLLFPVSRTDDRIFAKDRVHGIQLADVTRVYQFSDFDEQPYLIDQVGGVDVLVLGSRSSGVINSFFVSEALASEDLWMAPEQPSLRRFIQDVRGNTYDIFGEVVAGPDLGGVLDATPSYMGFYFAWVAFNRRLEIYRR
ncbi:MAG: DUF3179 domain-containing protein [Bacteroidota bacterium]